MEKVEFKKKVYSKEEYRKVILQGQETDKTEEVQTGIITVEEFFEAYDRLFYLIPETGDVNSHEYLIKRSSQYINADKEAEEYLELIEEINRLRRENLEQEERIVELLSK